MNRTVIIGGREARNDRSASATQLRRAVHAVPLFERLEDRALMSAAFTPSIGDPLVSPALPAVAYVMPASVAPAITVGTPNGGEAWQTGTSYTVNWSISGTTTAIAYQHVALSLDGGANWTNISPSSGLAASARSFSFTPTSAATSAMIRVRAMDSAGYIQTQDTSNSTFTITNSSTAVTTLTNGMAVNNLSGALSSERLFKIAVPAGATNLVITISGGTGDCDLYVRQGQPPTTSQWDQRPYLGDNNETATIATPATGDTYIMLRGYAAYTGVTLNASYAAVQQTVATPTFSMNSGTYSGAVNVAITTSTPSATIRYTLNGSDPTDSSPIYTGPINIATTSTLRARAYAAGMTPSAVAAASYTINNTPTTTTLVNGVAVNNLSGAHGSERMFRISVPTGATNLVIQIAGGTGDADVYVRQGQPPTTSQWDQRPYLGGNAETVTIATPAAGDTYIMIRGYAAYSGVTLTASYAAANSIQPLQRGQTVSNLSGAQGSMRLYSINVPSDAVSLTIRISGGSGDADLYARYGTAAPSTTVYDFRPYLGGNAEAIHIPLPRPGVMTIGVRAWNDYSGVALTVNWGVQTVTVNSTSRWMPTRPPTISDFANRSSSTYNTVINQFNVENNPRYQPTATATWCNIFAWDVMSAMNAVLPHWVNSTSAGVPVAAGQGVELSANATQTWLANHGANYGWRTVSASEAQAAANMGRPTVALWQNPDSSQSGHIMVVRPGTYSETDGCLIADAGLANHNAIRIRSVMGTRISAVTYWVFDR